MTAANGAMPRPRLEIMVSPAKAKGCILIRPDGQAYRVLGQDNGQMVLERVSRPARGMGLAARLRAALGWLR